MSDSVTDVTDRDPEPTPRPEDYSLPSVEQVLSFARMLSSSAELRAVFNRIGAYGLPNQSEWQVYFAAREKFVGEAGLVRPNLTALNGAFALMRKVNIRELPSLECEQARQWLVRDHERNVVEPLGPGYRAKPTSLEEIMWIAQEMQETSKVWSIFVRIGESSDCTREELAFIQGLEYSYKVKNCLFNKPLRSYFPVLRRVSTGRYRSIESKEAWDFLASLSDVEK
jgi:hypothetical protein